MSETIADSDVIIIGPGGYYTTILANLVIDGVSDSIVKSRARKILILNLMTEFGQTYGFTASKFITVLNDYLPIAALDFVIINNTTIPSKILEKYNKLHASPVNNDLPKNSSFKIIEADLLSKKLVRKEKSDNLQRSLVRHSPDKIAKLCLKILNLV